VVVAAYLPDCALMTPVFPVHVGDDARASDQTVHDLNSPRHVSRATLLKMRARFFNVFVSGIHGFAVNEVSEIGC
jgi:hypothetical protein